MGIGRRRLRRLCVWAGALCVVAGLATALAPPRRVTPPAPPAMAPQGPSLDPAVAQRGRNLFVQGCSSCHGFDAQGIPGTAPSLRGVGARAADFYLSTGRMPLERPRTEPERAKPAYNRRDIDALIAYVASFGGPPIPAVDPQQGKLNEGLQAFTEHCAGCHQVLGAGGIATGAVAPPLQPATPTQIAEAVRTGPYLMPSFDERQIDQAKLDSLTRYVVSTRTPPDRGGWGIGHIGPIPEGMIAWLLAAVVLFVVARLIGERGE
jgi:ubiquinol-cytochrome c reductase cytochrome c subunit